MGEDSDAKGDHDAHRIDTDVWKERAVNLLHDRRFQLATVMFLLALIPRLMFMEHGLWQDEGREMIIARNLLQGEGLHHTGSTGMPHPIGFFVILALAFLVFGASTAVGTGVVAVLGALTAVVSYLIGEELYDHYVGVAAAVFVAFNPIHWHISIRVLTDVPVAFFMVLTVYCMIRAEREESDRWFYATAVSAGLAALTKVSGLVVLPAIALYALYHHRWDTFRMKRYWIGAIGFIAAFLSWEIAHYLRSGTSYTIEMGLRNFRELLGGPTQLSETGGVGSHETWFYATNLPSILGVDSVVFYFIIGLIAMALYWDRKSDMLLIYLGVVFTVFTLKTYNLHRYFLPFVPVAVVIAGYGVATIKNGVQAVTNRELAIIVFLGILVAVGGSMYQTGAESVAKSGEGFAHLDDAGQWLNEHTDEDDMILVSSKNQVAWYADHDNVKPVHHLDSPDKVDQYVRENDVTYVEVDRWERLVRMKTPFTYTHYLQSPMYRPVTGYPEGQFTQFIQILQNEGALNTVIQQNDGITNMQDALMAIQPPVVIYEVVETRDTAAEDE